MAARFFGPLPATGVWTAVGLGRGQFVAITGLAIGLFVVVGGPLWDHVRDGHLGRLAWSYGVIPVAVAIAQYRNRTLGVGMLLAATGVIALVKLIVTAGLLAVLGVGR